MTGVTDELATQPGSPSGRVAQQPRQLIVTVYGLYSRDQGGWLSVATLVSLLAGLGVDEQAVRSSISRLKRRGILEAVRRDAAGYQLSVQAQAILREGDVRIFRRSRPPLSDGWLLAVFSVPESERNKRHVLRSQLTRLGFGTAASGVWIAPAHLYEPTADMLRRLDLTGNATLFRADHLAFGDLREKVRQWWDLDQLAALYEAFLRAHSPMLRRWRRRGSTRPAEAFADYVRVLTDWRQLPYLDPGLPAELLPTDWVGSRAADLFFTLQAQLDGAARDHVRATIARR
ncbi:MAG TPA: PaaX family transcriptional regulator C-terminal domain-containing protein [Pseudonocardiaceae bacterium]|nr:PaaX family transcriptional regulator C-terminal domain-containing protein [Pseudonocardiaceae bacterium]